MGAYSPRPWSSPILMYSISLSAFLWTVWTHRLILHFSSQPTYFFSVILFYKSWTALPCLGVLTTYWISLFFSGRLPVLLFLCCWFLFIDGLSVLILDGLAESLISVLAICTGVGLCVYWNCVCVHLGGFPLNLSGLGGFFVDDSCFTRGSSVCRYFDESIHTSTFFSWSVTKRVARMPCSLC